MPDNASSSIWYYRKTSSIEGPCDLIELAGYLASGDITPETDIRKGESGYWLPFRQYREFTTARDMPPGLIVRHLDEEIESKRWHPIRWIHGFIGLCLGVVIYTAKVWFYSHFPLARHDSNDWLMLLLRTLLGHQPPH